MTDQADERRVLKAVPTDLFIGGAWREGSGGRRIDVLDPSTEQVLTTVADATVRRTSPVAGSRTSNVPPSEAGRQAPPMNSSVGTDSSTAASEARSGAMVTGSPLGSGASTSRRSRADLTFSPDATERHAAAGVPERQW